MNLLSVHYNSSGNKTGFGDFLRTCYDSGHPVGVIYSLNGNLSDTIRRYSPGTKWVYRRQSDGWERLPEEFFSNDPVSSAQNWLTAPRENGRSLLDNWRLNPADWFDPLNEPVIELPPNPTPQQVAEMIHRAQWLNTWMCTALEIAHANGFKLALFSFPFGSPPYEAWIYLLPALRLGKQYGAILSLHSYTEEGSLLQYNPDGTFTQGTIDTTLRHRQIYARLPADAQLPLLYSEFSPSNGYGVGGFSGSRWVEDVGRAADELAKDIYIIGLDGFQLGGAESNLVSILPEYAEYISTHTIPVGEEDMPLNIIVTENLIPQDTNPTELAEVYNATYPVRQDVMWSADTVRYLVKNGLPGSKAIVWNPERWSDDILAYLDVPVEIKHFTPVSNPPPASTAWRGLQMRADGNSNTADFQCLTVGKLNAAKIMTNTSFEELATLKSLVPNIMLRLFTAGDNPSLLNAATFVAEQRAWLTEFNRQGGRLVEIHNEPNLVQEGLDYAWRTPGDFARWYSAVYTLIKSEFPNLQLGYPGLSPQPNVGAWQASIQSLVSQGKVDWVGAHSYWISENDMNSPTGGQHYRSYLNFGKPVYITEFANVNPADSHALKGQQYKRYYSSLVGVRGAFAFVSSASDRQFNTSHQTWAVNNILTDIPKQVA